MFCRVYILIFQLRYNLLLWYLPTILFLIGIGLGSYFVFKDYEQVRFALLVLDMLQLISDKSGIFSAMIITSRTSEHCTRFSILIACTSNNYLVFEFWRECLQLEPQFFFLLFSTYVERLAKNQYTSNVKICDLVCQAIKNK